MFGFRTCTFHTNPQNWLELTSQISRFFQQYWQWSCEKNSTKSDRCRSMPIRRAGLAAKLWTKFGSGIMWNSPYLFGTNRDSTTWTKRVLIIHCFPQPLPSCQSQLWEVWVRRSHSRALVCIFPSRTNPLPHLSLSFSLSSQEVMLIFALARLHVRR